MSMLGIHVIGASGIRLGNFFIDLFQKGIQFLLVSSAGSG